MDVWPVCAEENGLHRRPQGRKSQQGPTIRTNERPDPAGRCGRRISGVDTCCEKQIAEGTHLDKGTPVARRGRKARGLSETAQPPKGAISCDA